MFASIFLEPWTPKSFPIDTWGCDSQHSPTLGTVLQFWRHALMAHWFTPGSTSVFWKFCLSPLGLKGTVLKQPPFHLSSAKKAQTAGWGASPLHFPSMHLESNWCKCLLLFFFFFFICSEFYRTLKWNSHGFTCVPHPDPPSHLPLHSLPLGLSSAPGPSACLMIQPGLVICFTLDNIHVSMLFSWNIPPSPSPTESKRLFYKSLSFFFFSVLHIGLSLTSF